MELRMTSSKSALNCDKIDSTWVHSSAVERFPDKKEAHGPTPCAPTEQPSHTHQFTSFPFADL